VTVSEALRQSPASPLSAARNGAQRVAVMATELFLCRFVSRSRQPHCWTTWGANAPFRARDGSPSARRSGLVDRYRWRGA